MPLAAPGRRWRSRLRSQRISPSELNRAPQKGLPPPPRTETSFLRFLSEKERPFTRPPLGRRRRRGCGRTELFGIVEVDCEKSAAVARGTRLISILSFHLLLAVPTDHFFFHFLFVSLPRCHWGYEFEVSQDIAKLNKENRESSFLVRLCRWIAHMSSLPSVQLNRSQALIEL